MTSHIGIYGEKSLHRDIKSHIEPSGDYQEIPVGNYIADIKNESGITEIQTQSFHRLRAKLDAFLSEHPVTLVYPLPREKIILWSDEPGGRIVRKRRSPKRGNFYGAFRELYRIKALLTRPNLKLRIVLVDVSERRAAGGGRKGYRKLDTEINAICGELSISEPGDYRKMIPDAISGPFTVREYAAASGLNARNSGVALNVLRHVGAIEQIGKSGRMYLYTKTGGGEKKQ